MKSKTIDVYYDLGLFKDAKYVKEFLDGILSFLADIEKDLTVTTSENHDKFVSCNPVWNEFVTAKELLKYYSRAKEIYLPELVDEEVARSYYEKHLGVLGEGDLYSLTHKDGDYVVFLIMYLLMLKDGAIHKKVLTNNT